MSLVFEKVVGEEDDEFLVSVVLNGKVIGTTWRDRSRVYTTAGVPTPRFVNRWFSRLEGADDDEIIGKGMARAGTRKGDGYFDRHAAVRALLDASTEATAAKPK